tara:strand:- start:1228 stop:1713 length:486 start_codon:yes stop_codon:yes gene_type:complete
MAVPLAAAAVSGMDTKKTIVVGVVVLAVVALAYFGIIRPITNKVGLTRDKDDRKGDKAEDKLSRKQVLSPQLYRDNKSLVSISSAKANRLATEMHDGRGYWYDDEDMGVGAITSAGSKINISYVAHQFNILYGKSMESFMSYLEPEDWTAVDNYISKIKKS